METRIAAQGIEHWIDVNLTEPFQAVRHDLFNYRCHTVEGR
jgi:hypothetical protein